jgi:hypothetical protein
MLIASALWFVPVPPLIAPRRLDVLSCLADIPTSPLPVVGVSLGGWSALQRVLERQIELHHVLRRCG